MLFPFGLKARKEVFAMRFTYCPDCGARLVLREIGDEGRIPYCETCRQPRWDMFVTSVICAAVNDEGEIALIRQGYVSKDTYVCVAGIMKPGETAEQAAAREVAEELGVTVQAVEYLRSDYFPRKEMLMLGFRVRVQKAELHLSGEVDSARWVPFAEAPALIRPGSIARRLVCQALGLPLTS